MENTENCIPICIFTFVVIFLDSIILWWYDLLTTARLLRAIHAYYQHTVDPLSNYHNKIVLVVVDETQIVYIGMAFCSTSVLIYDSCTVNLIYHL